MKGYTKKQRDILRFIADYQAEHGVSPSLEDIGDQFGVHRVTIFQHVAALERRGALRRSAQLARSIEILDPEFLPEHPIRVLGTIAAGRPLEALEEPEPLDVDRILPADGEHYALRVKGDSMIEDSIRDGDVVIVRRTRSARNGQVVVAVLGDDPGAEPAGDRPSSPDAGELDASLGAGNGEATLKRYFRLADGRVRLEPANRKLRPVIVHRCEIRGVVKSVVRSLD